MATEESRFLTGKSRVSIHATLAGGDLILPPHTFQLHHVSIHATLAGGDSATSGRWSKYGCFYPRHPRGWRPLHFRLMEVYNTVSIHATLAGGDKALQYRFWRRAVVSIHATLAGGDQRTNKWKNCIITFLSTPPSRVATVYSPVSLSSR